MKIRGICALIVVAGAAASAQAGYNVDVRCTVSEFNPSQTTGMIQVWVNHTGGTGGGNFGPSKFKGNINVNTGTIGDAYNAIAPFSNGPTAPTNNGTALLNVDSFRGPVVPGTEGATGVVPPEARGAGDSFVLAFEVPIVISDFTQDHVTINIAGQGQRIASWQLFLGSWNPRTSGTGVVNPLENATDSLTIPITPAPAAASLLALGGLFAGRRRRA